MDTYRTVQKVFKQNNTEFHSHSLPQDRTIKVVIMGLLLDIAPAEVAEELKNLGFEPKHVRQFSTPLKKMPIHIIILLLNLINKDIFNIHSLFYMSVKAKSYRSDNRAQSYACQRFEYSSLHCNQCPRCVKCVRPHQAKDCLKILEVQACANCKEVNTANYKKCPKLLQIKAERQPNRTNAS